MSALGGFLESTAEQDLWMANWYLKEPIRDGGKTCIPMLKVEGANSLLQEINTNDGKAKVLAHIFFPKKPDC